ncbi:MAG: S9 family peptidase [Symbiobacterium sp.]|uniref:S9 family peptidase n=1 Tax=Symbiobacterium sp. TaxID=1971213 RepID=UPI003463CD01
MTTRRRLSAEDLLAIRLAGDCQIAPDGSRVAYVLQEIDKEKNEYTSAIWLAREGAAPLRFTGGRRDTQPRWSPDGRHLVFVSNRSGSNQLWLLSLEGGEARQLTRVKGGVESPVWGPDGRLIAFLANLTEAGLEPEGPDEEEKDLYKKFTKDVRVITRLHYKMDGEGYFTDRRKHICVIDVEGGEPRQLTRGDFHHRDVSWTPDGRGLLFAANRREDRDWYPDHVDLWYLPLSGGEPERLTPGDGTLCCSGPVASPDGRLIAFLASDPAESGYGPTCLHVLDRTTGEIRRLAAGLDRTFGNEAVSDLVAPAGGRLTWSPDSRWIYGLVSDGGQVHLVRVGAATGAVVPVTGGDRVVYAFSLTPDCRRAALAFATPRSPGDVYLARLDDPCPTPAVPAAGTALRGGGVHEVRLTAHNEALLDELELTVPERFQVNAGEGEPAVDAWILPPVGREPGKKYPAVLEIHGGPMSMYGANFFFEFHWLAAQGYAVVYSNPRGSQGYGHDFCRVIRADWGNKDYADVMAVIEAAVERYPYVDGDRLGVAGGSYGGFMVNWIVSHTDRFKAAVTMRSVVNRWSAMGTSDIGYYRLRQFGTENWWEVKNLGPYLKQSPLVHASHINTPLLIEHQENDMRCPIDQGEQLYVALKFQRKPVKFVRYPGESHGMSRTGQPWHRVHRLRMIAEWFAEYL